MFRWMVCVSTSRQFPYVYIFLHVEITIAKVQVIVTL